AGRRLGRGDRAALPGWRHAGRGRAGRDRAVRRDGPHAPLRARPGRGGGPPLAGDPQPALDRIAAALSAETVGVAQKALEMAVEYARERKQFGRPIGSYQAVSHRCAQMLLEVEGSRSAAYYAGWCADAEPDSLPRAA